MNKVRLKEMEFWVKIVIFCSIMFCLYILTDTNDKINCMSVMKEYRIQVPKVSGGQYDWGSAPTSVKRAWRANDCESEMKLQKTVLTEKDVLPPEVLSPKLSKKQNEELYELTVAIIKRLEDVGVEYFPVFGTTLAAYRNGLAINPWDDDIDLCVDNRDGRAFHFLTDDLNEIPVSDDYNECPGSEECHMWELDNKGTVLTYKPKGVPFKVTKMGSYFPVVDLTTFNKVGDMLTTPENELATGHIHSMTKRFQWVFPLVKHRIKFSYDNPKPLDILMPANSQEFIYED